jgi:hypothetical protein
MQSTMHEGREFRSCGVEKGRDDSVTARKERYLDKGILREL